MTEKRNLYTRTYRSSGDVSIVAWQDQKQIGNLSFIEYSTWKEDRLYVDDDGNEQTIVVRCIAGNLMFDEGRAIERKDLVVGRRIHAVLTALHECGRVSMRINGIDFMQTGKTYVGKVNERETYQFIATNVEPWRLIDPPKPSNKEILEMLSAVDRDIDRVVSLCEGIHLKAHSLIAYIKERGDE